MAGGQEGYLEPTNPALCPLPLEGQQGWKEQAPLALQFSTALLCRTWCLHPPTLGTTNPFKTEQRWLTQGPYLLAALPGPWFLTTMLGPQPRLPRL